MAALDRAIETAADEGKPIVFFWPAARTCSDVSDLLELLAKLDRWAVERVGWVPGSSSTTCFSVRWKTQAGELTEVAGFAPLPEMPLTRRAPYLAIAAWGGLGESATVGLVDTPWPVGEEDKGRSKNKKEDEFWKKSLSLTGKMLAGEDRTTLRSVAFRLGAAPPGLMSLPVRSAANAAPSKSPPSHPPEASGESLGAANDVQGGSSTSGP